MNSTMLTYLMDLTPAERAELATLAGSSAPYLVHVAKGRRRMTLGKAEAFLAACQAFGLRAGVKPGIDDVPLTEEAAAQRELREKAANGRVALAVRPAVRPSGGGGRVSAASDAKKRPGSLNAKRALRFTPY